MCRPRRALLVTLALAGVLARGGLRGHAEPPLDPKAVVASLHALEAKALIPLLRAAVKSDHRRQAWWLAGRLLAVQPRSDEATLTLKTFSAAQLQEGEAPSRAFVVSRDAALKKVGAAYAKAARQVTASGAPAVDAWPLVERALALGNQDADVLIAAENAGETFCGGFGMVPSLSVEEWLGKAAPAVTWLPEWDDAVLRVRVAWPEAKAARIGALRVVVGGRAEDALPRLALVAAVEAHFLATFGSNAKEEKDPERAAETWSTLVWTTDAATFETIAKAVTPEGGRLPRVGETPEGASSWFEAWRRIAVVLRGHRDNAWVPPDALLSGMAAYLLARHHLVSPGGGRVFDSGTWAFTAGIRGLYEGFAVSAEGLASLDPCATWRMAVARAARDRGAFLAWNSLLAMNGHGAAEQPLVDLPVTFREVAQSAKRVMIASAQATALVAALVARDGGKGVRRFTTLLAETAKRGAAPDLDKSYGTKAGTVVKWIDEFLDGCR